MNWTGCTLVEVIPGKVSGAPLVRGSRVPADFVLDNFESGETVHQIAYNFGLNVADVEQLLAYAASPAVELRRA